MIAPTRVEPIWVDKSVALAFHDRQLAEHGGPAGLRDEGMLDSALMRPVHQWTYGEDDPCRLAAAYAFGMARNHPFVDGNKRTAWILARLFLARNGVRLDYNPADAIRTVFELAAGSLSESDFTDWLRNRSTAP